MFPCFELIIKPRKSKNNTSCFYSLPQQQLISLICVKQLVLCLSAHARLSGSLFETIALIYVRSSRILLLLLEHRVLWCLVASMQNPRDDPQHFRVWSQRGRQLINKTEWEFNQCWSDGGHECLVIRKGKRVNVACVWFGSDCVGNRLRKCGGRFPPGRVDVERVPPLGFSVYGNCDERPNDHLLLFVSKSTKQHLLLRAGFRICLWWMFFFF